MRFRISGDATGVYVIAATPFHDDGRIDDASIESLVEYYLKHGVDGLTILGVMGEAAKLSENEAQHVMQRFLSAVDGRVPVVVGVSNPGVSNLVRLAHASMDAGAAGVMVQPLAGLRTNEAVRGYIAAVVDGLGSDVPVCLQDFPQLTGVYFSAATVVEIVDAHSSIVMYKHEEWPGLRKLSEIRAACDGQAHRRVSILCGNGGLHLPQEYRRGADGAMTGFAFPEMMTKVHALFASGDAAAAEDLFDLYLPVLRHELQVGIGLALRKETLHRRGAIRSATVRAPGPQLTDTDVSELDSLLDRLEAKLARRSV